jgi:hypothetical protein
MTFMTILLIMINAKRIQSIAIECYANAYLSSEGQRDHKRARSISPSQDKSTEETQERLVYDEQYDLYYDIIASMHYDPVTKVSL